MRDYHHFLFFTSQIESDTITLDLDEMRHATKVLRLNIGDTFLATCGDGVVLTCVLDSIDKNCAKATVINRTTAKEISPQIHCYIGLPDRDAFEMIVTDLTAMGIQKITPLTTEYCQKNWWEQKWEKFQERLRSKMIAAMKQSLHPRIPVLDSPKPFDTILKSVNQIFVADIDGASLHAFNGRIEPLVNCLIGPPGGFSEKELTQQKDHQFNIIKVGDTRLRTELAAVVLCAQVLGMYGN